MGQRVMRIGKRLRKTMFSLPYREISCDYRGFGMCDPAVKRRIEEYFIRFLDGYHFALEAGSLEELGARLDREISSELVGFAYEGAGMYLALLDFLVPGRRNRVARFIAGPAKKHENITRIGIGLIFSRLPWIRRNVGATLQRLDPGVGWFAVDGYGFHEGFFHHTRYIDQCIPPATVSGYAARCFDHGLGRSIWFVKGAAPERIQDAILAFPEARRADLWAGIGLACAFAGGVHTNLSHYTTVLQKLTNFSGSYHRELGLGVVLAADTRYKAGTPSPWTSHACQLVLGMSYLEAGQLALRVLDETKAEMAHASDDEIRAKGYELARQKIMWGIGEQGHWLSTSATGG
jgi:hypothetical protein